MASTISESMHTMKDRVVVATILAILFLIAPGTLGILQFGGSLITQLDWVIFLFLALSVSVPVAVLNMFVFPFTFGSGEMMQGPNGIYYEFVVSAIASGLFLCAMLSLSFLFEWTLALTFFVTLCIEIILILVAIVRWWKEVRAFFWPAREI